MIAITKNRKKADEKDKTSIYGVSSFVCVFPILVSILFYNTKEFSDFYTKTFSWIFFSIFLKEILTGCLNISQIIIINRISLQDEGSSKETIEQSKETIEQSKETIEQSKETIEQSEGTIEQSKETNEQSEGTIGQSKETNEQSEETIEQSEETIEQRKEKIEKIKEEYNFLKIVINLVASVVLLSVYFSLVIFDYIKSHKQDFPTNLEVDLLPIELIVILIFIFICAMLVWWANKSISNSFKD